MSKALKFVIFLTLLVQNVVCQDFMLTERPQPTPGALKPRQGTTSCGYQSITTTLKFGSLTTPNPLPQPYGTVFFSSDWEVFNISQLLFYYGGKGIVPASGQKVVSSNQAVGSSITTYNTIYDLRVQSFYLGCLQLSSQGYNPDNCTLDMIALYPYSGQGRIMTQTFKFEASTKMKKFTTHVQGQTVFLALIDGSSYTQWYIDDLVLIVANPKCYT